MPNTVADRGAHGARARLVLENIARDQKMIAEIELGGDSAA